MNGDPVGSVTAAQRRGFISITVLLPLLGGAVGVNGAPVFQILAIENLGLDARQVGLAVGLGAISIPFQILAGRIPLTAAKRNLRLHILALAAMCLAFAWLVTEPGSTAFVVAAAIVIAVLAELSVSVLFATSFQPLLSTTVGPRFRQQLNAQWRAAASIVTIGLVALVGVLGRDGRIAVLAVLAAVGLALVPAARSLPSPPSGVDEPSLADDQNQKHSKSLTMTFVAIGVSVVPAWPLFVTYAASGYWPEANLGIVGAAIMIGPLVAGALWRASTTRLLRRARSGAIAMTIGAVALIVIPRPVSGAALGATVLLILAMATAAGTVVRMALLEYVHQASTSASSVASLTTLDVVASTSMQVGFLLAGQLIASSATSTWPADPFQLSLLVGGGLLLVALGRLDRAVAAA